ncbi:HIT domain protein [uncultured archaeon]|nr:HIT domain protein [uncultured archaeon]
MTLTPEQVKKVKEQLLGQIEQNFPAENKESAREQISAMNPQELEDFLVQNNLLNFSEENETPESRCIMCMVVAGKVKAYKIDENEEAIATLEIKPISKGHSLVIPKKHITDAKDIPKSIFEFAEKISAKLEKILEPKQIMVYTTNVLGHELVNILPIYKTETPESERKNLPPEELEQVQKEIVEFKEKPKKEVKEEKKEEAVDYSKWWLPLRLP